VERAVRIRDDDVELVAERALEDDGPIIWNDGPDDLVAAAGHDDQRLYVIPSEDLRPAGERPPPVP
jgi:hypothetical protein